MISIRVKSRQVTASLSPISHTANLIIAVIKLHARSLGNLASSARRARGIPLDMIPLVLPVPERKLDQHHRLTSCWCIAGSDQIVRRAAVGFRESWNPKLEWKVWKRPPTPSVVAWGWCGTVRRLWYFARARCCGPRPALCVLGLGSASFGVCTQPAMIKPSGSGR